MPEVDSQRIAATTFMFSFRGEASELTRSWGPILRLLITMRIQILMILPVRYRNLIKVHTHPPFSGSHSW